MNNILLTSYTIVSEDGVFVRLEETLERDQVVLSLTRDGKVETARLNFEQLKALYTVEYKLQCNEAKGGE